MATGNTLSLWLSLSLVGMGLAVAQGYSGKVLLISMDGFRWDYLDKVPGLGNFSRLAESGCTVKYVNNTFITKTFPSHFSIATGLYEESHGIVSNHMYDPERKQYFSMKSHETFWWEGGEPIWITAEKNKRNSSAVYFWPGSEARIQNLRPSIYKPYNESVSFEERTRTAIGWFVEEDKDFVALYFHEPDHTGHVFGPDSPEVAAKVQEMDGYLGLILDVLEERNLTDVVNVILTSDHGMTSISMEERLLDLWQYVNHTLVEKVPDSGEVTAILPKEGREAEVMQVVKKIPHVTAYRKEEIPEHFHYRNNPRIMPIIILSDEGWLLSANVNRSIAWGALGSHGYSNELATMKPIFFARGPDFRKGVKSHSIRSVDIYPLMCRLLDIPAAPNNGSLENTAQFLVGSSSPGTTQDSSTAVVIQSVIYVSLLGSIVSLMEIA